MKISMEKIYIMEKLDREWRRSYFLKNLIILNFFLNVNE